MKERGKAVEMFNNDLFDQDYSTPSDLPCKKHPSSSSGGVCAYCLKDRLVSLVCSDCGEQRLSSCSCSEISSNRNSCTVEVGSVGRISFLIENEKAKKRDQVSQSSNGTLVAVLRSRGEVGFGGLEGCLVRKEERAVIGAVSGVFEEKSDMWVVDYMGVSRCRSLCSFRGGGFFGSEDGTFSGARSSISAARSSISAARSSISAARNSGVNGGLLFDPDRKSGFSEAEPRKSGFDGEKRDATSTGLEPERLDPGHGGANTRRVFSLKEGNFTTVDDSGFIDLKFDFPSESRADLSSIKMVSLSDSHSALGSLRGGDAAAQDQFGGTFVGEGLFSHGGSCRITVSDRGIKRSRKSFKSWRWIFRQHPGAKKKDEDLVVKPLG
ncbi:hypothetical protein OIU84_019261 [Salix udensis]|uniref:Uncharacterized protein n=1 Tax=Salix udensis TaxID=889485 RepID=A0AAD6KYG0_9ROSI|nr:hypothetical protein OIU84_019261 [Salix udensis]